MVAEVIGTILIILVLFFIRRCIIAPRKILKNYADQLKGRGYRVRAIPYNILYEHFGELIRKPQN